MISTVRDRRYPAHRFFWSPQYRRTPGAGTPTSAGRAWRRCIVTAGFLVLLAAFPSLRAQPAAPEYQVKAGFIFNFARFCEWPTPAMPPVGPIRIGVLDNGPIFATFALMLSGRSVGEHPIEVVPLDGSSAPGTCHIVFAPRSSPVAMPELLRLVGDGPVLLVGETEGFAVAGGVIGFVRRGDNIRLQVSLATARQRNLQLSSRLSGLAEIVQPRSP